MLSIVIPVFNERKSLPHLWKEINHVLSDASEWEIIFIDDGSSDGTTEYLVDLCKNNSVAKLVQFYRNFGKSAALSEGFNHAQGDIISTMDGDLQDDPEEIPHLIKKLEDGYDLVSGWKKTRHDPWTKTFPSKIFNIVTRLLTGVKIHDFNCGLKCYRQAVVKSLEIFGGRHRYIPALAGQKNFRVGEIVINHRPRKYGKTKYGGLRLFGIFGLIAFIFGLVSDFVVLYYKFRIGDPFSKHIALLIFGVMLMVIGIQFFSIGLLGEMMARTGQGQENRIKEIISSS